MAKKRFPLFKSPPFPEISKSFQKLVSVFNQCTNHSEYASFFTFEQPGPAQLCTPFGLEFWQRCGQGRAEVVWVDKINDNKSC